MSDKLKARYRAAEASIFLGDSESSSKPSSTKQILGFEQSESDEEVKYKSVTSEERGNEPRNAAYDSESREEYSSLPPGRSYFSDSVMKCDQDNQCQSPHYPPTRPGKLGQYSPKKVGWKYPPVSGVIPRSGCSVFRCHKCHTNDHSYRFCPKSICYSCGDIGHKSFDCEVGSKCWICKKGGHTRYSCPEGERWPRGCEVR